MLLKIKHYYLIKEEQRQASRKSKSQLPFFYVLVLFVLLVFNLSLFQMY